MEIITSRADIVRTREAWPGGEFLPAHIFSRKDSAHWQVIDAPYKLNKPPSLSSTAVDEYIRIPLFAYRLSPVGDSALSFMLQFGASLVNYIPGKLKKLHIVTGSPVELVYQDKQLTHMNCWIGLAFVLE